MSEKQGIERRAYFRIDDEVALSYRHLSSQQAEDFGEDLCVNEGDPTSLANELDKMREISRIHFRHVEKESAEVARYFQHLEKKIDLLAHRIMMSVDELFVKDTQFVSISGSGIAFLADERVNVDDFLEIRFILKPSLTSIQTCSRVVSCEAVDGQYKIAAEFMKLSEDDRDVLIRHVIKKQMTDIRDQKSE